MEGLQGSFECLGKYISEKVILDLQYFCLSPFKTYTLNYGQKQTRNQWSCNTGVLVLLFRHLQEVFWQLKFVPVEAFKPQSIQTGRLFDQAQTWNEMYSESSLNLGSLLIVYMCIWLHCTFEEFPSHPLQCIWIILNLVSAQEGIP